MLIEISYFMNYHKVSYVGIIVCGCTIVLGLVLGFSGLFQESVGWSAFANNSVVLGFGLGIPLSIVFFSTKNSKSVLDWIFIVILSSLLLLSIIYIILGSQITVG